MLCSSWAALLGAVRAPTALALALLGVCVPNGATALLGAPGPRWRCVPGRSAPGRCQE
ncbi:hypothetical protein SEA_SAMTY_131 [Mycobacterium phage Samty]|nr:hypothetical protein SEA_SAMTY_131 [Mycobacterium phage Samty]